MYLCAADISQNYNSMEVVPCVLCCSKACIHECGIADSLLLHVWVAILSQHPMPIHAHLPYLHVSSLLQDFPIAPTTWS